MSVNRIPSLDGWRCISILLVISGHEITDGIQFGLSLSPKILKFFIWSGYGVDIFYVISGYIITQLFLHEENKNGDVNIKNFYLRRFFRIIPPFFVFLLVVYMLSVFFHHEKISCLNWITAIFLITNLNYWNTWTWSLSHLGSLSFEEQYYLIWPFIFRKKRLRLLIPLIVIGISPILRAIKYKYPYLIGDFSFYITRIDTLFVGSLFAIYSDKIKEYKNTLIENLILAVTLFCIFSLKMTIPYTGFLTVPFSPTLFSLSVVILIKRSLKSETILYKFLNYRAIVNIGKISYSLYLLQQLFYPSSILGSQIITKFPINFVCMFLCAYLSYKFIERPMYVWRVRRKIGVG